MAKPKLVNVYKDQATCSTSAPCQYICPIDTKIPSYVSLISQRRFEEAWKVIKMDNPFPSACARVCHHPCMTGCQANKYGDSVSVRTLKRVATDYALQAGIYETHERTAPPRKETVGVIGGGPAGLAAANDLALMGYNVTVYEALEQAGGAMMACIPEYRLPKEILALDVKNIENNGVKILCNQRVGRDISFEEIRNAYDAVFIGTGCHESKTLRIPDEDSEGVLYSMAFLNDKNLQRNEIKVGRRVGVIGGGNAAMDAARMANRQPECEKVTLVYRRTRNEMPAFEEEIEASVHEGVELMNLTSPAGIVTDNGRMVGLRCIKMELGEPDASGRRRPVPIDGSEFVLELDTLVIAIGENSNVDYLGSDTDLEVSRWSTIVADETTCVTNVPGIFAGGDCVTGPSTVIQAIGVGKRAAQMIHKYLNKQEMIYEPQTLISAMYMRPDLKLTWR